MSDKVLHTLLFLPARLDYKFAVGNRGKFRFGKNDTHTNRWDNILEIKQEFVLDLFSCSMYTLNLEKHK